jgi:hypothetical protein
MNSQFPGAFFDKVSDDLDKIQCWGATPQKGDMILSLNEDYPYNCPKTGVFEWSITDGTCLGYSWGLKVFLIRNGSVIESPHYTIRIKKGLLGWKANFQSK